MESAFDWQNMTYQFYNYFYANQSRWVKLYNFTDNDPLFANFLKAGYARILVPVMPGREREVLSFTLMGWNPGTTLPMLSNDAYIKGLLADLASTEPEEQPETESWITKVPTSLICLQPEAPFEQEDACDCDEIN